MNFGEQQLSFDFTNHIYTPNKDGLRSIRIYLAIYIHRY